MLHTFITSDVQLSSLASRLSARSLRVELPRTAALLFATGDELEVQVTLGRQASIARLALGR